MKKTALKKILKYLLVDVAAYALFMGIFIAIFYLVPYEMKSDGTILADENEMATFAIPGEKTGDNENSNGTKKSKRTPGSKGSGRTKGGSNVERGNTDTEDIASDESQVSQTIQSDTKDTVLHTYSGENSSITVTRKVMGSGSDTVTYYVADVYVSSMNYFKTAIANDTYGTNIKQDAIDIAENNNAILAITGDSYGNNTTGIVVRNGVLYRTDENEADVCILYTDGTMETYTADEFDSAQILEKDVWQAWCFGPELLDGSGNVLSEFKSTSYISGEHPRAAIGYVEPGHYVLVIVDGRNEGYSKGATLSELAAIMAKEGCVTAYNLDGGGSASMVYEGEYVNQSSSRDISDIIYIPVS